MTVHTGKLDAGLTLAIPEAFASELGLAPHSPVGHLAPRLCRYRLRCQAAPGVVGRFAGAGD